MSDNMEARRRAQAASAAARRRAAEERQRQLANRLRSTTKVTPKPAPPVKALVYKPPSKPARKPVFRKPTPSRNSTDAQAKAFEGRTTKGTQRKFVPIARKGAPKPTGTQNAAPAAARPTDQKLIDQGLKANLVYGAKFFATEIFTPAGKVKAGSAAYQALNKVGSKAAQNASKAKRAAQTAPAPKPKPKNNRVQEKVKERPGQKKPAPAPYKPGSKFKPKGLSKKEADRLNKSLTGKSRNVAKEKQDLITLRQKAAQQNTRKAAQAKQRAEAANRSAKEAREKARKYRAESKAEKELKKTVEARNATANRQKEINDKLRAAAERKRAAQLGAGGAALAAGTQGGKKENPQPKPEPKSDPKPTETKIPNIGGSDEERDAPKPEPRKETAKEDPKPNPKPVETPPDTRPKPNIGGSDEERDDPKPDTTLKETEKKEAPPADDTDTGDKPADDTDTGDKPADDTDTGDKPADDTATVDKPADDTDTGDKPTDDTDTVDKPTDDTATGDKPADDTDTGDKPADDPPPPETPKEDPKPDPTPTPPPPPPVSSPPKLRQPKRAQGKPVIVKLKKKGYVPAEITYRQGVVERSKELPTGRERVGKDLSVRVPNDPKLKPTDTVRVTKLKKRTKGYKIPQAVRISSTALAKIYPDRIEFEGTRPSKTRKRLEL